MNKENPTDQIYKIGGRYMLHGDRDGYNRELEPFEVILMALDTKNKYAMVRRPKCMVFVCDAKQLKERG